MLDGFIDDIKDIIKRDARTESLRHIARSNGFSFKFKETFAKQDYMLKEFSIFKGKKDKRLKGVMRKKEASLDATVRVYDYWYFGDFKKRKTTVFEIFAKDLDLPRFEIRPKGLLKQVTNMFWDNEKPYPGISEFHSKYEIVSIDADVFEREVSPKALEFLVDRKNISLEGEGDYLLVYSTYELVPGKELMTEYDDVVDLVEIVLKDDSNDYV